MVDTGPFKDCSPNSFRDAVFLVCPRPSMIFNALILEDSHVQATVIGKMLSSHGWTSHHCETVREATEALEVMTASALLLDIYVGQHNSLLHVPRFRKLAPNAPLILMTAGRGGDVQDAMAAARRAGANFVLQKPFTANALGAVLAEVERQLLSGGKRKHVLVIDDSKTVRHFTTNALRGAEFKVSQAESMEAAFDNIDIAHIDLVLCDVFMPGIGGLEGIAKIKATWPDVKVISMSAGYEGRMSDTDALQATLRVGADAQLQKPFTYNQVVALAQKFA